MEMLKTMRATVSYWTSQLFKLLIVVFVFTSSALSEDEYLRIIKHSPLDKSAPSNECTEEICSSLLDLINNSQSTIDFAILGFRDQPKILSALQKAKERGVNIRGIVDKDIKNKNIYKDTPLIEKSFAGKIRDDFEYDLDIKQKYYSEDPYKKDYTNSNCQRPYGTEGPLQCFEGKGYASKEKIYFNGDLMHNKFFIIDNQFVWTGSANISDTGIGGYNANNVVAINSTFIASRYLDEFNKMYNGDFHRGKDKNREEEARNEIVSTNIDSSEVIILFSPKNYAMEKVERLIDDSQKSIDLSIFFLTYNKVVKKLVDAHERGVKVRVIIDATGASNGYSKHQYLRDNGIKVKVENWGGKMHMKTAVIDDKHIVIGSMNWTKAGVTKNDENTLIIKNASQKSMQLTTFFNEMWNSIPDKWLYSDPEAESTDSINSCYDGIDNDFNDKVDSNDNKCK